MEPNNRLDNEFRKKLEQRTIQPSPMAWDRLDAMLSVTEEKKKPKRVWMYVAASFLGFLLVGTLFLKQGGTGTNTITPVKEDAVVKTVKPAKHTPGNSSASEIITVQPEAAYIQGSQVASAVNKTEGTKIIKPKASVVNNKATTIPLTINEGVAAVEKEQGQSNVVPTPDTDELLAQSLAHKDPAVKKKALSIDANSLLSSVEGELNQSFKEKALQGAIKNFNTIKTSVVNRNHQ